MSLLPDVWPNVLLKKELNIFTKTRNIFAQQLLMFSSSHIWFLSDVRNFSNAEKATKRQVLTPSKRVFGGLGVWLRYGAARG